MVDKANIKINDSENDNIGNYFIEDDFEYFGHLTPEVSCNIIWKRVIDINEDPCLLESHDNFIDGYVICGSQSASWFPVIYTMLRCNSLISHVLGDMKIQDNYNRTTYNGRFIFSFYGRNIWTDIIIDDRLPFISDSMKNIFSVSSNKEEFLPSLLEKAYARYLGGYGKFQNIHFIEAIMHFTGGVIQEVQLRRGLDPMTIQEQKSMFQEIRSLPTDTLAFCHTSHNRSLLEESNGSGDNILPEDHYYIMKGSTSVPVKSRSNVVLSVLSSIADFNNKLDTADLIRLHNPVIKGDWGGSYNLGSQEWESMSEYVRRHYNLKFEHEFEFWISMNDLCRNMSAAIFCHIPNDRRMDAILKSISIWYSFYEHGNYGSNIPDGFSEDFDNNFLDNDQYLVDCLSVKEVTIKAVLQVDSIDKSSFFRDGCGITIFKVENNRCYRLHDVRNAQPVSFKIMSSTTSTLTLSMVMLHGRYIILPWRKKTSEICYYLRIHCSQKSVKIVALTEDQPPFVDCFKCSLVKTLCRAKDSIMTTISKENSRSLREPNDRKCISCISVNPADAIKLIVIGAEHLETKFNHSRSNSYFIVRCGNYSYKSTVKTLTNRPIWNETFLFYRVDPTKETISVEMFYEEKFGFDKSLGIHIFNQYEIARAQDEDTVVSLCIQHDKEMVPTSSKIRVRLKSSSPSEFNTI